MAEAILRLRLGERGVPARVSSAGTVIEGRPATSTAVDVLGDRGLDISAHRSRIISPPMVAGSDLVVVMAREHVRAAAVLAPEAFGRIFTLKELVRRGTLEGPRQAGEPLDAWLARLHQGRRPSDLMGTAASPTDDVADPIGEPRPVYERTADELVGLIDTLVPLAWGAEPVVARGPGALADPA